VETAPLILVGIVVLIVSLVFVGRLWKPKSRWGIGSGTSCPRCAERLPMIRRISSANKAMWGGWTCPKCGCEIDKNGLERQKDGPYINKR
jgi:hypothetical protein